MNEALENLLLSQPVNLMGKDRINIFRDIIKNNTFTRKEYMRHFKDISTATASRDLKEATIQNILYKIGTGNATAYQYK